MSERAEVGSRNETEARRPGVVVVLPMYNEAASIASVLETSFRDLTGAGFDRVELLVVDDGSSDGCGQIALRLATRLPVVVLTHPRNRGLGAALATGLGHAVRSASPGDIILTGETDQTQPSLKLAELAAAVADGADVAVATPHACAGGFRGVPLHRRLLSQAANHVYRLLFPIPGLHDYTNLMRGFRARVLQEAFALYGEEALVDRRGFESVPDILLKLRRLGPRVREIGVEIDFTNLGRASSMSTLATTVRSLLNCVRHMTGGARPLRRERGRDRVR